jgi:hypothetical protein
MTYSVPLTIIGGVLGGVLASSEDLHPFVLSDCGAGVVHERTIWETPAAWAGTAGSKPITARIGSATANFLALTQTRKLLNLHLQRSPPALGGTVATTRWLSMGQDS